MTRQALSATIDGVSTNLYAYDVFGNMTNEVQNGAVIARDYDAFSRPTGYRLLPEGGRVALVATDPEIAVSYSYDPLGRFASVTAGDSGDVPRPLQTFAYTYLPGTDLVTGYTCGSFSRSVSYEPNRNLISAVTNAFNDFNVSTFDYTNDAAPDICDNAPRSQP